MKASIVDLRNQAKEILKALAAREPVSIYYHGKLKGTIVPAEPAKKFDSKKTSAFRHLKRRQEEHPEGDEGTAPAPAQSSLIRMS